jgi:spore coat protein U-like protein
MSARDRDRRWQPAAAAALALALAAGGARAECTFRSTAGAINFPPIDQSAPVTVTAFTQVLVRCTPAGLSPTWSFAGANGSAPLRMKHATLAQFLPYTMTPTLIGISGANETWRLTATVLGPNYQNLPIGSYSDVLVATITP